MFLSPELPSNILAAKCGDMASEHVALTPGVMQACVALTPGVHACLRGSHTWRDACMRGSRNHAFPFTESQRGA